MPDKNTTNIHGDLNVTGDFVAGDKHVTIIQKFFNIFKSDSETLEQRNRRILLGHVENAWIKGVLDASLYGAAMLDLGIKETPEAITNKYPWTLKKESTNETLLAGLSMLEIFDSIGMGRSLLILGAPGSGKTTMLLELARGLIERAREDVTQPIPMVFNLASWTEKLTLADWLAQELNNLYSIPRKTAPDWVKGNKLLLLLDGLDEVRQDSRAKCVEAINEFRKQNGLTSLAVCSRSQDYSDLNAKLSFEGAIEVQPLTQKQITEFFSHYTDEFAGIKLAVEKDSSLREMTATPLFLSITLIAYQGRQGNTILDENTKYKKLFDAYILRMVERFRGRKNPYDKKNLISWLSWMANQMIKNNQSIYLTENLHSSVLDTKSRKVFGGLFIYTSSALFGLIGMLIAVFFYYEIYKGGPFFLGLFIGTCIGLMLSQGVVIEIERNANQQTMHLEGLEMVDALSWDWRSGIKGFASGFVLGPIFTYAVASIYLFQEGQVSNLKSILLLTCSLVFSLIFGLILFLFKGLKYKPLIQTLYPGQRLLLSIKNSFIAFILITPLLIFGLYIAFTMFFSLFYGISFMITMGTDLVLPAAFFTGLICGLIFWWRYGAAVVVQYYILRFILARNNLLPWRLVPFLDHCVDLIFLRRVGGGYIFVHRLLMEHFAEMYVENPTSKGN